MLEKVMLGNCRVSRAYYARIHPTAYVYYQVLDPRDGYVLGIYHSRADALNPDDGEWYGRKA